VANLPTPLVYTRGQQSSPSFQGPPAVPCTANAQCTDAASRSAVSELRGRSGRPRRGRSPRTARRPACLA